MLITGIRSKPVYAPLRADTGGRYHLMLGRGPGGGALLRVLSELQSVAPALLKQTRVLFTPDAAPPAPGAALSAPDTTPPTAGTAPSKPDAASSTPDAAISTPSAANSAATDGSRTIDQLHQMGLAAVQSFPDAATLLTEFRSVLEQSLMGTRLYVAGPESFIGLAMRIALDFNLNKDEIRAEEMGTLARRVYCVHCRATTEEVRTNIVRCTGCARWLLVRDHYSRRIAAYMGVMADAEAPGELPAIKEVFT